MKVFFEIVPNPGSARFEEFGCPTGVGITFELNNVREDVAYDELVNVLDQDAIAEYLRVSREELHVLTPQEYEEKYGGEDDD